MTSNPHQSRVDEQCQAGGLESESYALDIAALSENRKINRYGYTVGNMGFLVPENTLSEVLNKFTVYALPNTRPWMRGLVNLRGNLVPIFDVALLCGATDISANYENLLILDKGADAVGILIDHLPMVCDVDSWQSVDNMTEMLPGLKGYVKETYRHDDMMWTCFDHREYFRSIRKDVAL